MVTDFLTAFCYPAKHISLFILLRLSSMDECTYLSSVTVGLEWPKISERDLISKSTSTHRVANVCRRVWKWTPSKLQLFVYSFSLFCRQRGSKNWSSAPVKRKAAGFFAFQRLQSPAAYSVNGISLIEVSLGNSAKIKRKKPQFLTAIRRACREHREALFCWLHSKRVSN